MVSRSLIALYVLISIVGCVQSLCSNSCSGHGTCTVGNVCSCYTGWSGGAADCSFRECPKGPAWADKAYSVDLAHQSVECSNAGICGRSTGLCLCFDGYTGNACQRSSCPNDCSGRGTCMTIKDLSRFEGPPYDSLTAYAGDGVGLLYTNWDANSLTACDCDGGYFGADCSLSMCPKGDDPLTLNSNHREILLTVHSTSAMSGSLGVSYNGETSIVSLTHPSSSNCVTALKTSDYIGNVGCHFQEISTQKFLYNITFYSWPTFVKENNFHVNDGNPAITEFFCDTSQSTGGVFCVFSDVVNTDIPEYSYCSNRGICNFDTGYCACNTGFGGPACGNITYIYSEGSNALPGLQVNVNGLDYVSSALQIRSTKPPAADFLLIDAVAGGQSVFSVRGDGYVGLATLNLQGGLTINAGGLLVITGGVTVSSGGMNVHTASNVLGGTVASVSSTYKGTLPSTFATLQVSSLSSSIASQHLLFSAKNQGSIVFSIRADGLTKLNNNGLSIAQGGLTVAGGGLYVQGGMTVVGGGLTVTNGVTVVTGGLVVKSGGGNIFTGGLIVQAGGGQFLTGGMKVTGGSTVYSGGLNVNAGGMTVQGGGMTVIGGLSVSSGGLRVALGGAIVSVGGLSVLAGGVSATGGVTVKDTGVVVMAGGVTVSVGGLNVAAGGMTVASGGLTIGAGGVQVTGGLTLLDVGVVVVTGGATVTTGGLVVTAGGATVTAGGVYVTGGVQITGGLSVFTGAIYENQAPSVSDRRLKTNISPLIDPLDKITRLRGVYFDWVKDEASGLSFDEDRHVGLLAQDVQQILPEVVHEAFDGRYLSVDYVSLIPLLVEAVRELRERTEGDSKSHGERLRELGVKVSALESGAARDQSTDASVATTAASIAVAATTAATTASGGGRVRLTAEETDKVRVADKESVSSVGSLQTDSETDSVRDSETERERESQRDIETDSERDIERDSESSAEGLRGENLRLKEKLTAMQRDQEDMLKRLLALERVALLTSDV